MRGRFFYWSQRRKLVIFCLLFIFLGEKIPGFSQPSEYLLKAIFLEKFTRFIEWPDQIQIGDTSQSFNIGILGENPFDLDLMSLFENQKIKNRPVNIRYLQNVDEIEGCHLLFISKSEKNNLYKIIASIGKKPILTIGDSDDFSGKGVIINMFISNNKVRFEIDEHAVQRAGFHVSYLLLKEAEIVNPNRDLE